MKNKAPKCAQESPIVGSLKRSILRENKNGSLVNTPVVNVSEVHKIQSIVDDDNIKRNLEFEEEDECDINKKINHEKRLEVVNEDDELMAQVSAIEKSVSENNVVKADKAVEKHVEKPKNMRV